MSMEQSKACHAVLEESKETMAEAEPDQNKSDMNPSLDPSSPCDEDQRPSALEGVDTSLMPSDMEDLNPVDVTFAPANVLSNTLGRTCKPYPFNKYHDTYRYVEGDVLDPPESGASNLIEPCHEYKAFTNTTEETKMAKFICEVIRFAAACMNSRTNGTIHFGIGDTKMGFTHGQILGVDVGKDRDAFDKALRTAINQCFEFKHKGVAQICIKPPRFVGVLNKNMTTSDKFVIEVDIFPDSSLCQDNIYYISTDCNIKKKKKQKQKSKETNQRQFFVREGESSNNLLALAENDKPVVDYKKMFFPQLLEQRKKSEQDCFREVKSHQQGSKLCEMITGGKGSLDRSYYNRYIIVTNKCHNIHLDSMDFLAELNPIAVLDFDPQSSQSGLFKCFEVMKSPANVYTPDMYTINEPDRPTDVPCWIFCNGGIDDEQPSEINHWSKDKGASVQNAISFLCQKDVLRNKKLLVVFLLLSRVNDEMDPLVEAFCTFYQELKGTKQILCICDNESTYTSWKNLVDARCDVDISNRCIYELSFSEVNGTILSLLSENRRSIRFLPSTGGSRVALEKKVEHQLSTLDILCVNQCEGGNEDQDNIEQNFYKGGQVSWWNFHFSEQPGSISFIKRDKFAYIVDTLIPELCTSRKACVRVNLFHVPGCGGTTLAKHILWTFRGKLRCAVLVDNDADPDTVAEHVVTLLKYGCKEQEPPLSVLLMIDDFEDMDKVFYLQELIEEKCVKSNIQSRSPLVILLNCMRSEYKSGSQESTEDSVFIENKLTDDEQTQFDLKREEMDKIFTPAEIETFYGFMLMKKNFNPKYFQSVVQHTLKSFDMEQKHAQLMAVLVLMSVYCKQAALSVSLCEKYLGLLPKPHCGDIEVEEEFQQFSTLVMSCDIRAEVLFKGVRMIHSQIAKYCLNELNSNHSLSKAAITNFLLTTDELYDCTQGKDKLVKDVSDILVKRSRFSATRQNHATPLDVGATSIGDEDKKVESLFSPIIQDIEYEVPGLGEDVLLHAAHRFPKDGFISTLVARYYCRRKTDFDEAKRWARNSQEILPSHSKVAFTFADVALHELKFAIANEKQKSIDAEALQRLLNLAKSALNSFRETRQLAVDKPSFQIIGSLGEIKVCVHVIEVLERIPLFSADRACGDIDLASMLSRSKYLDQMKKLDSDYTKNISFYEVLQDFAEMLCNLKLLMKLSFDFLDKIKVNLGSKFGMSEWHTQRVQNELSLCFRKYAQLFCFMEPEHLLSQSRLKLYEARQQIEMRKVDTFSGILNCLSENIKSEVFAEVISAYKDVHNSTDCRPIEKINYILLNVVLSCIDVKMVEEPFGKLVHLLCSCLENSTPRDSLPLYFLAVLLLWPQPHISCEQSDKLQSCISNLKTAFSTEIKPISKGKNVIVHFFLGRKETWARGYKHIVHLGEVRRCINESDEQFASQWKNGTIWKHAKVEELLCRLTGEVKSQKILVHTCNPDINVEVDPLFPSQLQRPSYQEGSTVSFFVGFSIKGPLAIDIRTKPGSLSQHSLGSGEFRRRPKLERLFKSFKFLDF